jgi:flagellar hook protein FlgE
MSFYISLSGLKGAQADLAAIANNVANVGATAFKKSKVAFGDIYASSPMQANTAGGQGVRQIGATQQFTQGTLETTGKTLDVSITGEGFFTVKSAPPANQIAYTRNGAFGVDENSNVVDSLGNRIQVMPADADGDPTSTAPGDFINLTIPQENPNNAGSQLASVAINTKGLVTATYADGETINLGVLAMANFPNNEGLRQQGDAHWTTTRDSGNPVYGAGGNGSFGSVRSGTLERSNVDLTEELVGLISAQRNFQANAKAIEAASTITQTIVNMRT